MRCEAPGARSSPEVLPDPFPATVLSGLGRLGWVRALLTASHMVNGPAASVLAAMETARLPPPFRTERDELTCD